MSWRDLKPLDDWYELERPQVESGHLESAARLQEIRLTFTDPLSEQWFAEWLRSKRGWQAFTVWVDEKR